jgi:hypothetical protein
MSECAAQSFSGISPAKFACLVANAAKQGIKIDGNHGSASKSGITIAWNYDSEGGDLTIQCTETPFYLGCDQVNSIIQELVNGCP